MFDIHVSVSKMHCVCKRMPELLILIALPVSIAKLLL